MRNIIDLFPRKGAVYGGVALLLGLTLSLYPMPLYAADQRPIQLPEQTPRDFVMTGAARRAIQKDEQLAALNLGIAVNNRVATVWGNVPSGELNKRVDETLRKISGIAAVMNECRIVPDDPVPTAIADAVKKARTQGDDPATSAKFSEPPQPTAITNRVTTLTRPSELVPKSKGDLNEMRPGAPLLPPPPAVVLLSPIPADTADELNDWEMIRRSEPRFKDVTLDVKSGIIRINGLVARTKDAWELADKLNSLPSVRQVILGNVAER